MHSLKKIFTVIVLCLLTANLFAAKKVELEVNAPSLVAVGDVFKVEYAVNVKPDNFIAPTIEEFDVIAGPTTSQSNQVSITNGNMVQESRYSFIYVLIANKTGSFTIPSAKMIVDGKEYTTKPLPIEAIDEGSAPTQQGQQSQQGGSQQGTQGQREESRGNESMTNIAPDDIFMRAVVDKTTVYKGQPVRVSFKLYTRKVPYVGFRDVKLPAFNGFWKQDLSTEHYKPQRETYNSKVYETEILAEYLLFPQQSGTLQIEQATFDAVIQVVVQSQGGRSIFDDFFGGGPDIRQIDRKMTTSPVSIKVNELPAGAPASFNGAVGSFSMTSDFPSGSIAANSSATYTVKISGNGNLSLIQAPSIDVPSSFEQYNVKTTESLNKTAGGVSGYRQFEYPIIARAEGRFSLDPVKFTYFNPETARYVTLTTDRLDIAVLPDSTGGKTNGSLGIVSGISKEDLKILGEDIRFIKLGSPGFTIKGKLFMGGVAYWIILVLLIALFVFALVYLQKRIKLLSNADVMRGKRANKVALQRLKTAEEFMKESNPRGFYDEMLKALWGYMSDKLNIPSATLTKESVREELLKQNISSDQVVKYIDLISDCEYAQYSPGESRHMQDVYGYAVELISKFESLIKK